jgi:hypothetical protein
MTHAAPAGCEVDALECDAFNKLLVYDNILVV